MDYTAGGDDASPFSVALLPPAHSAILPSDLFAKSNNGRAIWTAAPVCDSLRIVLAHENENKPPSVCLFICLLLHIYIYILYITSAHVSIVSIQFACYYQSNPFSLCLLLRLLFVLFITLSAALAKTNVTYSGLTSKGTSTRK